MARLIGLEKVHVAKITKDDSDGTTYEKPVKLSRAIKAAMEVNLPEAEAYSENGLEAVVRGAKTINVEIEVNMLTLEERALLQGSKIIKGRLQENRKDVTPEFALGFQTETNDGKQLFVWLYKGSFASTSDELESKSDSVNLTSNTITGKFFARFSDGELRAMAYEGAKEYDKTVNGDVWFTAPVAPQKVA
jgi:phi13 family phage major tail protein